MKERNLDFNTVIHRKNTRSLKYDFAKERGKREDLMPLWVADMDFKTSSFIEDALKEMSTFAIFGYSEAKDTYYQSVKRWMRKQYAWDVEDSWIVKTPGIVFALAMAVKAFSEKGDAVLIQPPVYYPFTEVVLDNERTLVCNELKQREDGSYVIDFVDFEEKIIANDVKLFLLCNPHNPIGRVWSKEELERLGDICVRHNVVVVSDEIHADFTFQKTHNVFANVKESYRDVSVICTSPSKSFNLAGLQISNIFIANETLRNKFKKEVAAAGYSQVNIAGLIACEVAYTQGEEWLNALKSYIEENAKFMKSYLQKYLPKIKMNELEGTYLVWLDFREYSLCPKELNNIIVHEAKLWLDDGSMFGKAGEGFQRINIACPKVVLKEALDRLRDAFEYK